MRTGDGVKHYLLIQTGYLCTLNYLLKSFIFPEIDIFGFIFDADNFY